MINRVSHYLPPLLLATFILISGGYLGYLLTYGQLDPLHQQLLRQQQQLKQLHSLQHELKRLKQRQPLATSQEIIEQQWRWPKQAERLGLSFTLKQYQQKQPLHMTTTGKPAAVRQFLKAEAKVLRESQTPLNQLQLVTWQQRSDGTVQLSWQVSQQQNAEHLTRWRQQPAVVTTTCKPPPSPVSDAMPSLRDYRLTALITATSGIENTAYFSQPGQPTIKVHRGDWLTDPLAEVVAIQWQQLILAVWQQGPDCWQSHQQIVSLEAST